MNIKQLYTLVAIIAMFLFSWLFLVSNSFWINLVLLIAYNRLHALSISQIEKQGNS
jgi:hypothetical protein